MKEKKTWRIFFGDESTDWNKLFISNGTEQTAAHTKSNIYLDASQMFPAQNFRLNIRAILLQFGMANEEKKNKNKSKIPCIVIEVLSKLKNSFPFPFQFWI